MAASVDGVGRAHSSRMAGAGLSSTRLTGMNKGDAVFDDSDDEPDSFFFQYQKRMAQSGRALCSNRLAYLPLDCHAAMWLLPLFPE